MSAVLFMTAILSLTHDQDEIKGIWRTQDGNSKLEIYKIGDQYFGKIVWLEHPTDREGNPVTDGNNSNKSLRNRPLMGVVMLEGLVYKKGKWTGKLYAPKRGVIMDATLALADFNELKVLVSYLGFTREQNWHREPL